MCGFAFIYCDSFHLWSSAILPAKAFFHLLTNRSIFRHVGGLFTGSSDGKYPGLAGLKESGELLDLIKRAKGAKEDIVSSSVEIFQ